MARFRKNRSVVLVTMLERSENIRLVSRLEEELPKIRGSFELKHVRDTLEPALSNFYPPVELTIQDESIHIKEKSENYLYHREITVPGEALVRAIQSGNRPFQDDHYSDLVRSHSVGVLERRVFGLKYKGKYRPVKIRNVHHWGFTADTVFGVRSFNYKNVEEGDFGFTWRSIPSVHRYLYEKNTLKELKSPE